MVFHGQGMQVLAEIIKAKNRLIGLPHTICLSSTLSSRHVSHLRSALSSLQLFDVKSRSLFVGSPYLSSIKVKQLTRPSSIEPPLPPPPPPPPGWKTTPRFPSPFVHPNQLPRDEYLHRASASIATWQVSRKPIVLPSRNFSYSSFDYRSCPSHPPLWFAIARRYSNVHHHWLVGDSSRGIRTARSVAAGAARSSAQQKKPLTKKTKGVTITMEEGFQHALDGAKKVTVLTGAGVSAESGIPTFRGEGGLWRMYDATELANPRAFAGNPSRVWEFYHYRREVVMGAAPNDGHYALAALEKKLKSEGKQFTLLTQNIDGLHRAAGSENVVEIHGSLWQTRCTRCGDVAENREMPICPALEGKGSPGAGAIETVIPTTLLPRCKKGGCNALLRPNVVWFTESLDPLVLAKAYGSFTGCDLMMVIGTSAVVQPAASFALVVLARGGAVAEFNVEETPLSERCKFVFKGSSAATLPHALGPFLHNGAAGASAMDRRTDGAGDACTS